MKRFRYNYAIAQRAEWNRAVNQFMALFGGTIGRHKSKELHLKDIQVFIGIGDAPSKGIGGRFINYLVKILKALGYNKIFQVNESYTSQYCPLCGRRVQLVKGEQSDEFGNTRKNKSFRQSLPVFVCLIIVFGIGVIWMVVIPNYIRKEIDNGMGDFMLDKLNISAIGNKKIYFQVKSKIHFIQDPRQVSVTAEITKNKLDIQLLRNGSSYKSILNLGIPHFYYSTDESLLNMSFVDVVQVKNVQLLSALISDFALNNSNPYSIQFISYPIISIPGLPGSWKVEFIRSFDFIATSTFNTNLLNNISIREYKMTSGKGDDGSPKVFIAANASIFNSEPISLPLIDASLKIQIFYKEHHVLTVEISNVFLNPSGMSYPLPILIETFDWSALQELIYKYSEGQDVVVNLKNFRVNTENISKLKWIEGLVYGLDFPLALPKVSGDGIFQLCRGHSKEKVYFNSLK